MLIGDQLPTEWENNGFRKEIYSLPKNATIRDITRRVDEYLSMSLAVAAGSRCATVVIIVVVVTWLDAPQSHTIPSKATVVLLNSSVLYSIQRIGFDVMTMSED